MSDREIHAKVDNYCDYVHRIEDLNVDNVAKRIGLQEISKRLLHTLAILTLAAKEADTTIACLFYYFMNKQLPIPNIPDVPVTIIHRLQEEDVIRLIYSVLGSVSGWAGCVTRIILDYVKNGKPMDWVNISEEIGNCTWYTGAGINVQQKHTNFTFRDILTNNIRKLAVKYRDKFPEVHTMSRDLDAERQINESVRGPFTFSVPQDFEFLEKRGDGWMLRQRYGGLYVVIDCSVKKDGQEWIHVSYSRKKETPNHSDTIRVKEAFLKDYYAYAVFPTAETYINIHPHCLHLWARADGTAVLPEFSEILDDGRSSI